MLHGDRRNPRAHEACAKDTEFANERCRCCRPLRETTVLFQCSGGKEEIDELFRDCAGGQRTKPRGFLVEAGLDSIGVAALHRIDGGKRRGIVALGLRQHRFTRLFKNQSTTECVVFEQHLRRAMLAHPQRWLFSTSELTRALHCDRAQDGGMDQLVHESNLIRFFGADILARENHVECDLQSNNSRQTLRTTRSRNQSELHFGKRKYGFRMFSRDAVPARERHFETAAKCGSVYRRDDRLGQRRELVEQTLAASRQCFALCGGGDLRKFVDVGTGNPRIDLATQEHRRRDRRVAFDETEDPFEHGTDAGVQGVDGRARLVVDNDGHTIFDVHRDADISVVHDAWLITYVA